MKTAKCPVKMYLCIWKNIRLIFLNLNPGSLVLNETTTLKNLLSFPIQTLKKVFWVKSKKRTWIGAWWDFTMKSEAATENLLFGSCITSKVIQVCFLRGPCSKGLLSEGSKYSYSQFSTLNYLWRKLSFCWLRRKPTKVRSSKLRLAFVPRRCGFVYDPELRFSSLNRHCSSALVKI